MMGNAMGSAHALARGTIMHHFDAPPRALAPILPRGRVLQGMGLRPSDTVGENVVYRATYA